MAMPDELVAAQQALADPAGASDQPKYWDDWFEQVGRGKRFEWYAETDDLLPLLRSCLPRRPFSDNVLLHVGSGNSELIFDLAVQEGMTNAVAVDCSEVAVTEMRSKLAKRRRAAATPAQSAPHY